MALTETPYHHGSHRDLLWVPQGSAPGQVDAIIVPTIRHPRHLDTAVDLATRLDCTLVTLHSGKWTSAVAAALRIPADLSWIGIDVPDQAELRLADFETTRLTANTAFDRRKDTSVKRNFALLLAHMVDWRRIIFLDDDITVPIPADLRYAAGLLDNYNAVGLSIGGFPDNSVVCHAFRAIGGSQQSFIGGGALAVETTRNLSFFPDIYNEDWFYMLDRDGLQPVAVTGTVVQAPYEPYRVERARMEELGDVLAEGIFWVLDQGGTLDDATSDRHWRGFLPKRRRFIEYVLANIDKAEVKPPERDRMEEALKASLGRLARIQPEWCEKYLRALVADRATWEAQVRDLRDNLALEDALTLLSERGTRPLKYVIRQPPAERSSRSAGLLT